MTIDSGHGRTKTTRRRRALALAVGTLMASVAVAAPSWGWGYEMPWAAHAKAAHRERVTVPREFFGVQPGPTPLDDADAAKIASTGVRTVRIGFNWLWVQPRPGPFNWTKIDDQVAPLAAHGVESVPTLAGTPSWIAGEPTTPPIGSPEKKQAWKTFVTAAARRYGPGGTFWRPGLLGASPFHKACGCDAPPVPIASWQVWNEPNLEHYYTPQPSPGGYARLLKTTRSAIRVANPQAEVVLAGLSDGGRGPNDVGAIKYLKRLYRIRGARRAFDATAIHPYARNVGGMRDVITAFRAVMKKHGDRRTPMWVTEIGWGSAPPNGFGTTKGVRGQREIVEKSMRMLLQKRGAWRLQRVYWFYWRDPPKSVTNLPCRICYSAGLLRPNREPKPAYRTFKRIASRAR